MTRRVRNAEKRPFYAFPWSPAAKRYACELATVQDREPTLPALSLRTIAAELLGRGFVEHKPAAKTLARMLERELPAYRAQQARGAA